MNMRQLSEICMAVSVCIIFGSACGAKYYGEDTPSKIPPQGAPSSDGEEPLQSFCENTAIPHLWRNMETLQGQPLGPRNFVAAGGKVTFANENWSGLDTSLWITDGTEQNTMLLAKQVGTISGVTHVDDTVYYSSAANGDTRLWSIDTQNNTIQEIFNDDDASLSGVWSAPGTNGAIVLAYYMDDSDDPVFELRQYDNETFTAIEAVPREEEPCEVCTNMADYSFTGVLWGGGLAGMANVAELGQVGDDILFGIFWPTQSDDDLVFHFELWEVSGNDNKAYFVLAQDHLSSVLGTVRTAPMLDGDGNATAMVMALHNRHENDTQVLESLWISGGTTITTQELFSPTALLEALILNEVIAEDVDLDDIYSISYTQLAAGPGGVFASVNIDFVTHEIAAVLQYDGVFVGLVDWRYFDPNLLDNSTHFKSNHLYPHNNTLFYTSINEAGDPALYAQEITAPRSPALLASFNWQPIDSPEEDIAIAFEQSVGLDGSVLFWGNSTEHGMQLWKSDGTPENTTLLKDAFYYNRISLEDYAPRQGIVLADTLLFGANDGTGRELWRSQGSLDSTRKVYDLNTGDDGSHVREFFVMNNALYFHTTSTALRQEQLWRAPTDSDEGELLYAWPYDPTLSLIDAEPVVLGNHVYFLASDAEHGTELWKSDGTAAGTALLKDIFPGSESSNIETMLLSGERFYFAADDSVHGNELWGSDGTEDGTTLLADTEEGEDSGYPFYFVDAPMGIVFRVGNELWISDGTPEHTSQLDLEVSLSPTQMTTLGNKIVFAGRTSGEGREPWITDGTPEGTLILKDVCAGDCDSDVGGFWVIDNMAYFGAHDEVGRALLWRTDGTPLGTEPVVNPSETGISGQVIPLAVSGRYMLIQTGEFGLTPLWLFDAVTLVAYKISDDDKSYTPVSIETASGPAFILKYFDEGYGDLLAIIEPDISYDIRALEQPLNVSYSDMYIHNKEVIMNGEDVLNGEEPWCMRFGE